MGFRLRKSIGKGPFRVNLSKSGVGFSVGTKGARITKKANGNLMTTLNVPGTGLSYVKETSIKKDNTSKQQEKTTNIDYINSNILNKFQLTNKEKELLEFLLKKLDTNTDFTIHDISIKGYIAASAYYNNLYNKGLLIKPAKGKYSINFELLNKYIKEEQERIRILAIKEQENKSKNRKLLKRICKFCAIPMILGGIIFSFVEPTVGIISIIIGILELFYGFRKEKDYV